MNLDLEGRTVLVAGASQGIGFGIVEAFCNEGARVMMTSRGEARLAEAHGHLAARFPEQVAMHAADMTATSGIVGALDATESAFGVPDVLIANVGGGFLKAGWDVGDDDLDAALTHNLTGTMRLVREGIRRMEGRAEANITVISSIAGVDVLGAPASYGVAKAGLNHFVGSTARLVGPGLRINSLAPGNILFEGGSWARNVADRPEQWQRWIKREVALQRFGSVEEIADVVAFLSSPRAAFVTGATWIVDGGQVRSTS